MSQEKVLKTLENLGLTQPDAQIYIFLGKKGPQKAKDIAKFLRVPKQTLYRAIKNLQSKGLITATLEHPAKFSAVPFDRVLDLFVKAKTEEAHRIEQDKTSLLSDWQSIVIAETSEQSPRFTVIEGRNYIYPRLRQMIEDTKIQLSIVSTVQGLMRADQFGLLGTAFNHASKTNTKFRLLTELSQENLKAMKLLLEKMPKESGFEGRTPELGLKLISRMLIRDDAEAAFFVSQDTDRTAKEVDDVCLWTNSTTIVNSFKAVFEDLWHNSTGIEKRIAEIETGKPTTKTCVISDPEAAQRKCDYAMGTAKTEIIMVTSSAGLVEAWKNIALLKERAEKGVSVKIMAPITRDNWEAALRLSECAKVRHVPPSYSRTTVVDAEQLFQFKSVPSDRERLNEPSSFENAFYTNDLEYVVKTKSMLDEFWKHAVAPSAVTVGELTKPPMPVAAPVPDDEYTLSRKGSPYQKMVIDADEKPGAITEEYVLNKMINAKRIPVKDPLKDPTHLYSSNASAVIHPPSNFNLPDMLLAFFHCNKQSSFGAEDWFLVYLWLETPNGNAFVPVAIAGDNPKEVERRKSCFAGTPASQNQRILKKNELQIQVHGNTLFAGWTVPIPLFPPQYTLPPGAVLFEGYGKLKPTVTNYTMPSGWTSISEVNGLEAFVTFFHPASKYAGPGTDGVISREMIMTVYPPHAKRKQDPRSQF
ncbi:MAG TPA: helix-turn-helix domain-containing protein [Candidatus Bathyarchaeia archaeon]